MPTWLTPLVIVLAVASRPIESRLWRAGRISDRTLALLLLGRFPLFVVLVALTAGGPSPFLLVLIVISLLPGLVFYRSMLSQIRASAAERDSN